MTDSAYNSYVKGCVERGFSPSSKEALAGLDEVMETYEGPITAFDAAPMNQRYTLSKAQLIDLYQRIVESCNDNNDN